MIKHLKQIGPGFFDTAKKAGRTFEGQLGHMAVKGEVDPDLVNPDLLPGYAPANVKPQDALQQILKKKGITWQSRGEVFFTEPGNEVLFPAVLDRAWRDYRYNSDVEVTLSDLVIATVGMAGVDFKGITLSEANTDGMQRSRIAEGAELPRYRIASGAYGLKIRKYGGAVEMTYEVQRRSTVGLIVMTLQAVARQDQKDKVIEALAVMLNGDGNSNAHWTQATAGATYDWADMVVIKIKASQKAQSFANFIGDETEILEASKLVLPTANKPSNGLQERLALTGEIVGPAGYSYKVTPPGSVFDGSKKLAGYPAGGAVVYYQEEGSVIQEVDRIISHQVELFTFSEESGFGKPEPLSVGALQRP